MPMWYLGALVPLFPIGAALVLLLMEKWDNRRSRIRRMVKASWQTHERRQRYSSAGCNMRDIGTVKIL